MSSSGSTGSTNVAVGVMLSEVVAHTVDESGKRAFVTQDVLQCLRKVCCGGVAIRAVVRILVSARGWGQRFRALG